MSGGRAAGTRRAAAPHAHDRPVSNAGGAARANAGPCRGSFRPRPARASALLPERLLSGGEALRRRRGGEQLAGDATLASADLRSTGFVVRAPTRTEVAVTRPRRTDEEIVRV